MWQGLMKKTGADYGIAVTGIAGPTGATPAKPIGTIWYALGGKAELSEVGTLHLKGDRPTIIRQATEQLFDKLWERLQSV
jgi:nicotinamide-nucleotide amidase